MCLCVFYYICDLIRYGYWFFGIVGMYWDKEKNNFMYDMIFVEVREWC